MIVVAIVCAIIFDAMVVLGLRLILSRSADNRDSGRPGPVAVVVCTVLGIVLFGTSTAAASLATVTVRTRIVMYGLARREPFATIIAHDRTERDAIEQAVRTGLEMQGSVTRNVPAQVRDVLTPYMAFHLSHADDAHVVAYARLARAELQRARAAGGGDCAAITRGEADAIARHADQPAMDAWLHGLLLSEPVDIPAVRVPSAQEQGAVALALGPNADPCTTAIAAIDAATTLPTDTAAETLRGIRIAPGRTPA